MKKLKNMNLDKLSVDLDKYKNVNGLLHQWGRVLVQYAAVWVIPTVVFTVLAIGYLIFRTDTWEVSQTMIVRNEAIGTDNGIGRFSHAEQMKTVEETILEVTYSRDVLAQTLKTVGPGSKYSGDLESWPEARDIDDFRNAIGLAAPEGAEFGTTEVLYLTVKADSPERGTKLVNVLFNQLEAHLRKVRNAKVRSVVAELVRASELARENLNESTSRLTAIEKKVGADLSELRMMNHIGGNESNLQRTVSTIRAELRDAKLTLQENQILINLLESAENDTERLLATPNRLLESQPSLRALKNGLIAAQLKTDEMQGRMLDTHPQIEAAIEAERATRDSLHREVKTAILGLKNNVVHEKNRISLLEAQRDENIARLQKLAEMRATYANLVKENENRAQLLQKADEQFARVRAQQESTLAINLIEPIGTPDPGSRPIGPGKKVILAVGMFGGLFIGLGLLFMMVPIDLLKPSLDKESASDEKTAAHGDWERGKDTTEEFAESDRVKARLEEEVAELARARAGRK